MWQSILLTEAAARQLTSTSRASGFPPDRLQPEFVRPAGGKRVLAGSCRPAVNTQPTHRVRLAEWSKAPDLSSGSRERAWVRTPHLTIQSFAPSFRLRRALILRAGRPCVVVAPRCDAHLDAFGSGETKQSGGTFIIAHIGKLCPFGEILYSAT